MTMAKRKNTKVKYYVVNHNNEPLTRGLTKKQAQSALEIGRTRTNKKLKIVRGVVRLVIG